MVAALPGNVRSIMVQYVCPSIGVILSNMTFAAPVRSVRKALNEGSLGQLNSLPWAVMTGNTLGWLGYSFLTRDLFVFFGNFPGFLISLWLNVSAAQLQYSKAINDKEAEAFADGTDENHEIYVRVTTNTNTNTTSDDNENSGATGGQTMAGDGDEDIAAQLQSRSQSTRRGFWNWGKRRSPSRTTSSGGGRDVMRESVSIIHRTVNAPPSAHQQKKRLIIISCLWLILVSILYLIPAHDLTHAQCTEIIGIAANVNLAFFYGAPLSTIRTVLATKSSSSIHRPTMLLNTTNAFFWVMYGAFGPHDPFIWVPNGIGFALGVVQVVLCLCYRMDGSVDEEENDGGNEEPVDPRQFMQEPLL